MFGVTAGYHRYFSHRSYKLGRVAQFLMAVLAQTSGQKGVLWWAAHHRDHHRHSDTPRDVHSPREGWLPGIGREVSQQEQRRGVVLKLREVGFSLVRELLPVAALVKRANPAEVTLIEPLLNVRVIRRRSTYLL